MKKGRLLLAAGFLFGLHPAADAGDQRFGIMTHFAQGWDRQLVPRAAQAHAGMVRDELYWDQVEPEPGRFSFPPRYDDYMAALKKEGVSPLIALTFANRHYDGGMTPHTPEGVKGYARYANAVLDHYDGQIPAVEIWNEYNGSFCEGPAREDRAGSYLELLKNAYAAIKEKHPAVQVAGGATSGLPLPWLEKLFAAGALSNLDAVSVHPYRYQSAPEGIEREVAQLTSLIKRYNGGVTKPIWVTEIGWGTRTENPPIDELEQAKFLVRGYGLLLSAGVEKIFWYLLRDYDRFSNMGLLRDEAHDYEAKPAYRAFEVMARQLDGRAFVSRDEAGTGAYALTFERNLRVLWAPEPRTVTLEASTPLTLISMLGETSSIIPTDGAIQIPLTDSPVYLLGEARLPSSEADPMVIADSQQDFSGVQGEGGWLYGFDTGSGFQRFPKCASDDWRAAWSGGPPFANITRDDFHPGVAEGRPAAAIRRWISPLSGTIQITGHWLRKASEGDGVRIRLVAAGAEKWASSIGGSAPASIEFDVTFTVKAGDAIDFSVDPGEAGQPDFDATTANFRIVSLLP